MCCLILLLHNITVNAALQILFNYARTFLSSPSVNFIKESTWTNASLEHWIFHLTIRKDLHQLMMRTMFSHWTLPSRCCRFMKDMSVVNLLLYKVKQVLEKLHWFRCCQNYGTLHLPWSWNGLNEDCLNFCTSHSNMVSCKVTYNVGKSSKITPPPSCMHTTLGQKKKRKGHFLNWYWTYAPWSLVVFHVRLTFTQLLWHSGRNQWWLCWY